MNQSEFIKQSLKESSEVKLKILAGCEQQILSAAEILINTYRSGSKLLLCGNGGSAADCQHIAAELVIRLSHKIQRPSLPAIALTTDSSFLTAGGNDIGFENVFARAVEGLGQQGDTLIAISTSGNSPNIINAAETAREKGLNVIGLLGGSGGKLKSLVDIPVLVPSDNVQRIQEGHITIAHILCEIIETELFGGL